jgi:hypothetical protein
MANLNPLQIKIQEVTINKFNGSFKQSILPQFVELSLFQSIFEPVIQAEMLINDNIGLFVNYPFNGEEIVDVTYTFKNVAERSKEETKSIKFLIKGVRDIAADDRARALMFIIDLVSVEFLQNTRKMVSHAYNERAEDAAKLLYEEYIKKDTEEKFKVTKDLKIEESIKVRQFVIPNMRPLAAIQWLAKHAVAKEYKDHFLYLFYEDMDKFNFLTVQKLIEDALDGAGAKTIENKKYKYVSDVELGRAKSTDSDSDLRFITNLVTNKRFSSIEKVAGGYFQNELFEISMLQKSYESTPTELEYDNPGKVTLGKFPLNTKEYIDYVKNKPEQKEYSNRIRYILNNFPDSDDQSQMIQNFRYKFGNANKYLYALNQVDLNITVPANMELNAGDIIFCELPENHAFNIVEQDGYISGYFIVTEVKQVLTAGDRAVTTMRVNKDGYLNRLATSSKYSDGGNQRSQDTVIDPQTGKPKQ